MAEVSNDLIFEVLKGLQSDVRLLKDGQNEIKQELISIRGQLVSINQDLTNIYSMLSCHEV